MVDAEFNHSFPYAICGVAFIVFGLVTEHIIASIVKNYYLFIIDIYYQGKELNWRKH